MLARMEEPLVCLGVFVIAFGTAIFIVWNHPNWKGQILAALTLWIYLFMGMTLLLGLYSTGGPAAAMTVLWLLTGWFFSAVFCISVASLRKRSPPPPKSEKQ